MYNMYIINVHKKFSLPLLRRLTRLFVCNGKLKLEGLLESDIIVSLEEVYLVLYKEFKENPFWQKAQKDRVLFESLPPLDCIKYRDGVLIVDGHHRAIIHLLTGFNLKFNILD